MATDLDHDAIKTRIVAILQSNTSLYTTIGESGKLRKIEVGHPLTHRWKQAPFPYAFVSYKNERNQLVGTRTDQAINGIRHIVNYDIYFVVNEKDSRKCEEQLDAFQKLILETLEAKSTLSNPVGSTDPKCVFSIPATIEPISETVAKAVQGRIITLTCQMRTSDPATGAGEISEYVNSSNITLTNATNSLLFKNMFNVRVFITSAVTKRQLTNDSIEKHFDPRDFAVEADIFVTEPELATWISYTVQTNNLPDAKSFQVNFPDGAATPNSTVVSGTMRLSTFVASGQGNDDALYHIRLESVDGAVGVA